MLNRQYLFTSLENAVKGILDDLDLKYASQLSVRSGFVIDFAIFCPGNRRIALEVDGEFWHSSDRAKKRDRFKDYQLKREGWEILRIQEDEIDDPAALKERLVGFLHRKV